MNKKIILSLGVIGAVAAIAVGGTIAYFSDTETSAGNIFVAGTIDLKVDHTLETYNDAYCKTCSVVVKSDTSDMVVEKFGGPITPYPAVYVGSNPTTTPPHFIHSAWTAQNDPELLAANAKWIWESDPTQAADLTNNVTYTFEKDFEWFGPIVSTDLYMAVGSDNSVEVFLNGHSIGVNAGEFGYKQGSMLIIPAATITPWILQGDNVLKFTVKNFALADSTPYSNPGGLIYKFEIDGNCGSEYFKTHCKLWGLKDLGAGDTFWNFDDVKPGDHGTNVISLHAYDNDAYACLMVHNIIDAEDTMTEPEEEAGDNPASVVGELSDYINFFAWEDEGDGVYEGETVLTGPNASFALAIGKIPLTASNTKYIGLAWCAGTQSLVGNNIVCDGSGMGNIAQTDILSAYFTAYAEQQRNNEAFDCKNVVLPQILN